MENLIEELTKVNPANLSEEGLKLFNKINEIIDRNEKLKEELMEKELMIDGLKEDRRIAIEEIQEEYYVSKDKLRNLEVIDINGFEVIDAEDVRKLLQEGDK